MRAASIQLRDARSGIDVTWGKYLVGKEQVASPWNCAFVKQVKMQARRNDG
jgi:hypothetical protein